MVLPPVSITTVEDQNMFGDPAGRNTCPWTGFHCSFSLTLQLLHILSFYYKERTIFFPKYPPDNITVGSVTQAAAELLHASELESACLLQVCIPLLPFPGGILGDL